MQILAAVLPLAGVAPQALAQAQEEQALEAVRGRIQALERRRERQQVERDENTAALKRAELEIAAAERELARLRAAAREQTERGRVLDEQAVAARGRLDAERETLARQVRLAYMTGREELFKLLLSQESPSTLGRMMVYYDYFARARAGRIAAVSGELDNLARLAVQSARVQRELEALERAQAAQVDALAAARAERGAAVTRLDGSIAAAGTELDRLRAEERRLAELLLELAEALAAFPVNAEEPFAELKGRLGWPVAGALAADFGAPRNGGPLRWNGVLVQAASGATVRAVYHGRVVFADWLAGHGLLIIVDHGDGYLSLYGHNQALLKEPGDWVTPGEGIARVGDTGGLARASLYFEIREKGVPVNPHAWMSGGLTTNTNR